MATKLKNTNPFIKFICILLSIVLSFGATFIATDIFIAIDTFNDADILLSTDLSKDGYNLDDVYNLSRFITDNSEYVVGAYKELMTDDARKFMSSKRDDYIAKGLKAFQNWSVDFYEDFDEDRFNYDYDTTYNGVDICFDTYRFCDDNLSPIITHDMNTGQVENLLNLYYDDYLKGKKLYTSEYYSNKFDDVADGFYFYLKDIKSGKVYQNLPESVPIEKLREQEFYCVISKDEKTTSKNLSAFSIDTSFIDDSNLELSVYVDASGNKWFQRYIGRYEQYKDRNIQKEFILASLMLALAIALAVFSFIKAGNRDENGKMKLIFLDYIPTELHLAISAGGVVGLVVAYAFVVDSAINFDLSLGFYPMLALAALCCAGIWTLFIELVTSIIRVSKSEKHLWKNLLVVWIFVGLVKLFKLIHNQNKKNSVKLKAFLGYNLDNFKKRIILFLVGYGVINLFLLIMEFVWVINAYYDETAQVLACLNAILFVALNIVSVVFVTKYVVSLDKIITAAHNRTIPNVNYDKIPNSLKILVNSIRYSNQELQQAVNKAVRDEKMRTELITNVSHDLRTPLTSIITYVDLLKKCDIDDENAKEYIAVLDEKGIRLKRLIDDLIEASKVTSGVVKLNPMELNLSELATEAVVEHQKEFEENMLDLIFKGDKNNVIAFTDGAKTYRVIENLLSNARKYSAKGTRVYADVYSANNTAIFEIKNVSATPLDITPDELVERFVRGDKSRTAEGNGLGLSIADNLCRAMGGRLELSIDGDLFKARVVLPTKSR